MRRLIWGLILLMLIPDLASGQTTNDSWENLNQLQPGEKIQVVDMDLKSLKGNFVRFSKDAIFLRTKAGEVVLERGRVFRVSAAGGGRAKNAVLGAAVGAAGALALGLGMYYTGAGEKDVGAAGVGAASAAVGAGIGAGVGAAFPGWHTVYRAKQRSRKEL